MPSEHGCPIAHPPCYGALAQEPSARKRRDEQLTADNLRVHRDSFRVYGARKVWLALNRAGIAAAHCTVERLMRQLGLVGARRGHQKVRTTTET